jgi:phosphate transport system protein
VAVDALLTSDCDRGRKAIQTDLILDRQQRDIERQAMVAIARRQPREEDLREILAAMRIANDLERIGDLAKNIAKRVATMSADAMPRRALRGLLHMTELAVGSIRDVLNSYVARDSGKAMEVWSRDEEIDLIYTSLFREMLSYMTEDPQSVPFGIHFLFCAKNIERMGDHATNIAESVFYIIEGNPLGLDRPKADSTSVMTVSVDATR